MKKFLLLVVIVLGIAGFWMVGQYNSLVSGRAGVDAAWSNVEVQYQRRADIVPLNSLLLSKVQQTLKKEHSLTSSKLVQKQRRSKSTLRMLLVSLNVLQHKENSVEPSLVFS
jgi:LemA protein